MNYQQFIDTITSNNSIGTVLANPGGGTPKILSYSEKNIVYQRRNSPISVSFEVLYRAYALFKGRKVYTTDLRDAPRIFDSKRGGHSCNTTFFFSVLQMLGKVTEIKGEGKANHPFYISIIDD